LLNGVVVQDTDLKTEGAEDFTVVTDRKPTTEEVTDLVFANKCAKHLKSNTIALVKDGQMISMGCGQTSRVDALKQAIVKAGVFGFEIAGSVMASDAFFPFSDCVEIAHDAGVTAVVQPGGTIRDKDSIAACNERGMAMVTTGIRHFKH
jgi:phosphoribosylaminoimidazolecarboxamide formyltransferase/IMP cyclohydrolase